jgi:ubiquinone/menaquinone biosynthesis C-methylase UbiE
MDRTLTAAEAKSFYDGFGLRQDRQGWYENVAVDALVAAGDFRTARHVVEIGCGTGKLARRLLSNELNGECRYTGLDISDTMVALALERIESWHDRATVLCCDAGAGLPLANSSADRIVATYVLDLLAPADITAVIAEGARVLRPGGLFCVAGWGPGVTRPQRLVAALLNRLYRRNPRWLGGCRPLSLAPYFTARPNLWQITADLAVSAYAVPSHVLIARTRPALAARSG